MDKSEIGAHLPGLPPATARGLHNLFNRMLDEIHALRQAAHWHAPDAVIVPLDAPKEPATAIQVTETGEVVPPEAGTDAPPAGSEPIVPLAATETDAVGDSEVVNNETSDAPDTAPDTTDASADLPPAA